MKLELLVNCVGEKTILVDNNIIVEPHQGTWIFQK